MKKKAFNKTVSFPNGKLTVAFNRADEEPAVIQIYEDIGEDPWSGKGFTAKDFSDILNEIPRTRALDLRINSGGGNVWDGLAIKTLLDEWPAKKTASIDGMAASVASWLPMSVDEVRAPKHAQMFIHDAWGFAVGNAEDMTETAIQLDKTSGQIAELYANKTGMSVSECRDMMKVGTLMTAEEAHELGFIDQLTEGKAIQNFTARQIENMKSKLAVLNSLTAPKQGGERQQPTKDEETMNKEQKLALLNKWGVMIPTDADEAALDALIEKGKPAPANAVKFKNGKDGEHAAECDCDDCKNEDFAETAKNKAKNKSKSSLEESSPELVTKMMDRLDAADKKLAAELRKNVENRVKALVEADKIPAGQMKDWINDAVAAIDPDVILNRLEALPPRPPGVAPLNVTIGASTSIDELNRAVKNLRAPAEYLMHNRLRGDLQDRIVIGNNSRQLSAMINRLKKIGNDGTMEGPLRAMWDQWSSQGGGSVNPMISPRNANSMDAGLLRQVILSEVMRAFQRRLVALSLFAHTFQNVPLEGTDVVDVPYYPLDTVASSDFVQATGYTIVPNATTSKKSITVGGAGPAQKTDGIGRKYKGLSFSAYEIRRQPWLDIQKLTVMAGEQLALDVLNDIIKAWINQANFGNAVFSDVAQAFDSNAVATQLQVAANRADWPEPGRNVVVDSAYYANLAADPYVKAYLNIGSTDTIRQARIGGLYGFENVLQNPRIPQTGDANLVGWMSWPSAILVATAPIMPAPGEMLRLVSYETVVDDQTGLSFSYKYWGDPMYSADYEIIECCYGSGLGELAALKRIVSAGV